MAVALPATLAILVASVALGGSCLYSQKQLQSLPRARQSPSDWLEESGARNQVSGDTSLSAATAQLASAARKSVCRVSRLHAGTGRRTPGSRETKP